MKEPIFEDPYADAERAAREVVQYSHGPSGAHYGHGPYSPYSSAGQQQPMPMHQPYFGQPPAEDRGWAHQKLGPLPIWGWVLVLGAAAGGYYYYKGKKKEEVVPNPEEPEEEPEEDDDHRGRGGWCPSRTRVADRLEGYLKSKKKDVTVYKDAADAKRHVSKPSPLITLKPNRGKIDAKEIDRVTRREGLYAVANDDGSVGLYPTEGTKRGKEWEDYVDELRDNGQEI